MQAALVAARGAGEPAVRCMAICAVFLVGRAAGDELGWHIESWLELATLLALVGLGAIGVGRATRAAGEGLRGASDSGGPAALTQLGFGLACCATVLVARFGEEWRTFVVSRFTLPIELLRITVFLPLALCLLALLLLCLHPASPPQTKGSGRESIYVAIGIAAGLAISLLAGGVWAGLLALVLAFAAVAAAQMRRPQQASLSAGQSPGPAVRIVLAALVPACAGLLFGYASSGLRPAGASAVRQPAWPSAHAMVRPGLQDWHWLGGDGDLQTAAREIDLAGERFDVIWLDAPVSARDRAVLRSSRLLQRLKRALLPGGRLIVEHGPLADPWWDGIEHCLRADRAAARQASLFEIRFQWDGRARYATAWGRDVPAWLAALPRAPESTIDIRRRPEASP